MTFFDFNAILNSRLGIRTFVTTGLTAFFLSSHAWADQLPVESSRSPISYQKDVLPIFRAHCQGCHQNAKAQGSYVMTAFESMLQGGESGLPAIVPGKPDESHLIKEIVMVDGKAAMPKKGKPLNESDIELIKRWIQQGAKNDSASIGPRYTHANPPKYESPPSIRSLDLSPDGSRLIASGYHEALVYDTAKRQLLHRLIGMNPHIEDAKFSPDGSRIAVIASTPGIAGEVQVWDAKTAKLLQSRALGTDTLFGLSWSPDSKLIAYGSTDNTIRALDSETLEQKLFQGTHEDWPRATVFSVKSDFLVSAGRDMTVKLTEVATERFVDNITSITPGALRGGVHSLARHPDRNEILVGGADGSPKLYRMQRETARQIGDDANLIRQLPAMPGRIFSVTFSPDGKIIGAASTLDSVSQVRVWKYDFDGTVPEDIKKIQAKRVAEHTADEKKKLSEFVHSQLQDLATWEVPETSIYSLAIDRQGKVYAGGADGKVRVFHSSDVKDISSFEITPAATTSDSKEQIDALAMARKTHLEQISRSAAPAQTATTLQPELASVKWKSLEVRPASISLSAWNEYVQLLILATDETGTDHDVTHACSIDSKSPHVTIDSSSVVHAKQDGQGTLVVKLGSVAKEIPVKVQHAAIHSVDYIRDVGPALSRMGCNQGTCHGAQAGKGGFKLSLRGYDPIFDVRAFTDELAGRRVNRSTPQESLMLAKPLGEVPHQGGKVMHRGDRYATLVQKWIRDGAKLNPNTPRVTRLEMEPLNPIVQSPGTPRQLRVVAHYADGLSRDVTREAFIESGNLEVATINATGTVMGVRRGEAPLMARFEGAYAATTLTVMGDRKGFQWQEPQVWNKIDELVASKWQRMKIAPSDVCNDAEFIRRIYLDLTGVPPTSEQVRAFLFDPSDTKKKRRHLIAQLLESDEYVDHWTNKWSDLLQVNSKFLGKEGASTFKSWIREKIASKMPYDEFARSILTASGSNRENPPASYFKILRTPEDALENTTHLFLAVRFNCNKCHDHPFERWTQDQYYETAAYFAQVGLKKDDAGGDKTIGGTAVEGAKPLYEIVSDLDKGDIKHQRTSKIVEPKFPFDCDFTAPKSSDRRSAFAAWATSPKNPYFAKSYVNRLWGYLLGTGLIEPIDDIRAGNPASNPELLAFLEKEFIDSGFDPRKMMKLICESRTYQLSVGSNTWNADDDRNYSHAKARRLPAEVLFDAVHRVTGARSQIPGLAEGARAATLADAEAGLADGFLNNLGRPARESACECERSSDLQLGSVMALVGGPTVGKAISETKNDLRQLASSIADNKSLIAELFMRVLNRPATQGEIDVATQVFEQIQTDHATIKKSLEEKEAWWNTERPIRESQRLASISKTESELAARVAAIKPERDSLQAEKDKLIQEATTKRDTHRDALASKLDEFLEAKKSSTNWNFLAPVSLSAGKATNLIASGDRTIRATGSKDKSTYVVAARAGLSSITAVRLEALTDPELPGKGPGHSPNGNFVVTELELFVGPADKPKERTKVDFGKSQTDYDQGGFAAADLIDGANRDQKGWAVADAGGTEHWAVLTLKQPLRIEAGQVLEFRLHQYHNAADHRLARFRLSVTADEGEIPLGLSESFAAFHQSNQDVRTQASRQVVLEYQQKVDKELSKLDTALADAKKPLEEDATVAMLSRQLERFKKPLADDSILVQLRKDVAESETQRNNARLTAAEDLTWALINSPAFLFNH